MKLLILIVVTFAFLGLAFAQTTYEKVSDTEFKKTEQTSEETIYSIKDLLQQKTQILEQIKRQKEELKKAIQAAEKQLA